MTPPSYETQIALLSASIKELSTDLAETKLTVKALQDEQNKTLKWGVMALGSAVMGMGYWIFNAVIGGHVK